MDLQKENCTCAQYAEKIAGGDVFSLSRWGDGEWTALLGRKPGASNCDGHRFSAGLQTELSKALQQRIADPQTYTYLVAMQDAALRMYPSRINGWLAANDPDNSLRWHVADVFHRASGANRLQPLLKAMAAHPVILVGPTHLQKLKIFPIANYVAVPRKNCYNSIDAIEMDLRAAIAKSKGTPIVAISASMAAEALIHRCYPSYGRRAFLIDFGSLWDPYVGVQSRSYHRGLSHVFKA